MHPVANAVKAWRKQAADLASATLDGTPVPVRLDTDPDAEARAGIRVILSVSIGASESRAVVPISVTETVKADSGSTALLASVVAALERFSGGCYQTSDARIHRLTRANTTWDDEPSLVRSARIDWEGTASWL